MQEYFGKRAHFYHASARDGKEFKGVVARLPRWRRIHSIVNLYIPITPEHTLPGKLIISPLLQGIGKYLHVGLLGWIEMPIFFYT